jgi:hypothetical protein
MFDYHAKNITLTKKGQAGPRGINIGDPYEKVLQSFPLEKGEGWEKKHSFNSNFSLYSLIDSKSGFMYVDSEGKPTSILYDEYSHFLAFTITEGFVSAIDIGWYMD